MVDVLEIKGLNASWDKVPILRNVTVAVHSGDEQHAGEVVCLTGPNGGGKSTLLTLLAGIRLSGLKIDVAEMAPSINGVALALMSRKQIASHIAYLTQTESAAWNYQVRDIILTGRFSHTSNTNNYTVHDYEVVERVIETLHISALTDRNVFSLSGGEFQKVRIARALAQEPDFLLLDEPVANLDFGYQVELLQTICGLAHGSRDVKKPGILISIHDLNTAARFADKLVLLQKGVQEKNQSIFIGKPEEVLTVQNLHQVYGTEFGTFVHPEYRCVQVYVKE